MADDSASGSAQTPKQVWSKCAPCPLEWLAPAGLEPLPPASHIQRREVCNRVSSARGYPPQNSWGEANPDGPPSSSSARERKLRFPLRHPASTMAENWRGVGRV